MPVPHPRSGRRLMVLVAALALVAPLTLATHPIASAAPPAAANAGAAAVADPQVLFASSFESGDPQSDWENTVESGPDGQPMTANVEGITDTGLPGDISEHIVEVTASAENTGGGEVAENVADGDIQTKWLAFESTAWLQVRLDQPIAVVKYALGSANDSDGRDPRDWTLQASTDGQTWTDLDRRTGEDFPERLQLREFELQNTTAYSHYRLDITANSGDDLTQLAEWQLSDGSPPDPPSPNMDTRVDDGPGSTYTAKSKMGFTGVQSLEYGGSVTSDEGGYSYNKVFDVDIPVGDDTELRYLLFPDFGAEDDLRYPSTFAAVDLAFTDGTYLSDLEATDQNGFELSPLGQGGSKTPYTNQWNLRRADVGDVATGKTIDRILIGYDFPPGKAAFHGWVDDITISAGSTQPTGDSPAEWVSTLRGTNSTGSFSRGNNIPATAMPHGFNFWTPVTNASSLSWIYEYQRGNDDENRTRLQALSLSHETSPWMGDRQTFQVLPSAQPGEPATGKQARSLAFSHADEEARPYYYGADFANGISAEMAPTDHAAIMRFGFPDANTALVFDNVDNRGGLRINTDQGTVTGWTDTRSGLSNGATRMFVYAEFDDAITAGSASGVRGWARFDAGDDGAVTMRIATSLISLDQARHNLELEISDDDTVESVSERAKAAWEDKLDVIEVEGATPEQLTTLYSGLYRLFLYPNSAYENVGSDDDPVFRHAVQSSASSSIPEGTTETETGAHVVDGKVYVNNGFWDTYRTTWAAYSLLTPSDAGEMVDGFVQQYRDGGWVARWSSPGYANLMTGTSSDVAFADAAVKGVPGMNLEDTYDAAVKNATVRPPGGSNPNIGRKGMVNAQFLGWVPDDIGEGVSWALEGYINDYGIANMADLLAERPGISSAAQQRYREEAAYFRLRALGYINMFDDRIGFFQGRDAAGEWKSEPADYDPRVWGHDHDYTETDGWNFAFHVPHDGQGLANLYGGRRALADKLDTFYSTPETAKFVGSYGGVIHEMIEARDVRLGQWGFSNQVSHHIPWMYTYAGQPYKTQAITREVLSRMYQGSEIGQGYAGDEDNGETSAWYIFAALGLYPLQMGSENYVIGSPLFTKATVHLENGEDLVVNAPDNSADNVYVEGLKVDGEAWNRSWISHDVLADGATLDYRMTDEPTSWATGTGAAPPSLTKGNAAPQPLRDVTGPTQGRASASDGSNVRGLFDNTSTTDVTLPGGSWVRYDIRDNLKRMANYYTLTSADGEPAGDPTGWVLKGSNNDRDWTVLDQRSGVAYDWRVQTRPFRIAQPDMYSHYRIEFVGGGSVRLAELELLSTQQPLQSPLAAEVDSAVSVAGATVPVDVTVTNPGGRASGDVALTVPDGWSAAPTGADFGPLEQGESETVTFDVTVPAETAPGGYEVEAAVTSNRGSAWGLGTVQVIGDTIEFTPGTAAEVPWLFDADGSQLDGAVFDGNARFTDNDRYAIYRFPLPSDVTGGTLTLDMHNQFLIQSSTDGETWQTVLEETQPIRDGSNRGERSLDLAELLGDSDVLYIRLADSQPADGWGGWLARLRLEMQRP
ncbi:MAG: GH92 family glycosyl hydrolase [Nocardioidaceae bacterium]